MFSLALAMVVAAAPGHTRIDVTDATLATGCNAPAMIPDDGLDDTVAFEACQATLVAAGGGELYFPCGEYTFASHTGWPRDLNVAVTIESGVTLVGESERCVVLVNTSPGAAQRVVSTRWLDLPHTVVDAGIRNMTLRGNRTVCPVVTSPHQAHGLVVAEATRFEVENVRTENNMGDGIYVGNNVENLSLQEIRVEDYCRSGIVINSGGLAPTSTDVRIHGLVAIPAVDAAYGTDLHVETGVSEFSLTGSNLNVAYLGGVFNGDISGNTFRSHLVAGGGKGLDIHDNTFLSEELNTPLQCDGCGAWSIHDNTFYCGSTVENSANGTCVYTHNFYGDDSGSSLKDNRFWCTTPPCYSAFTRIAGGDNFLVTGNQVLGDGFQYGFVDQSEFNSIYSLNQIRASDRCLSINGTAGRLDASLNQFFDCTIKIYTTHIPFTDHENH